MKNVIWISKTFKYLYNIEINYKEVNLKITFISTQNHVTRGTTFFLDGYI